MKIITPPKNHFYITITDYYLRICNGNACAAALLKFYEHRHAQILDNLVKSGVKNAKLEDFQQKSSTAFLAACLLYTSSENTIKKANKLLAERGFIQIIRNFSAGEKLANGIVFMAANVQNAVNLGTSNLTNGRANLTKGLVKFDQHGRANLPIELEVLESIEKRESENFFNFKNNNEMPTLQDVLKYAAETKQDAEKAHLFYAVQTANNWLHNGKPINNWQSFFDGYKKRVFNGSVRTETPAKPTVPSIPKGEYF